MLDIDNNIFDDPEIVKYWVDDEIFDCSYVENTKDISLEQPTIPTKKINKYSTRKTNIIKYLKRIRCKKPTLTKSEISKINKN